MEINESILEGFYSRYISRDLANLLGGGVFIVICWISFRNQLHDIPWDFFLPPILWEQPLRIICFLTFTYFVGFFFDRKGDTLAVRIIPIYNKIISFIPSMTQPSNPFNEKNKITIEIEKDYKSQLILKHDLINKGKYDNRILDQLERYITLWILGKSVGLSAFFGSFIMVIGIIINFNYINDLNILPIYFIIAIFSCLFGLDILKRGSEAWTIYHRELLSLSKNMKDSKIDEKEKL